MAELKFSESSLAIGVDLGGHHLRAAVINGRGEILSQKQINTDQSRELDAVLAQMGSLCAELEAKYASEKVLGVGVGIPGFMDHTTGLLTSSPNFPQWGNVNLHEAMKKKFTLPCVTENDANLAGLGEYWMGAAKGAKMLVALTLGTGVGGAVVQEGRVLKGSRGLAGELGHMVIDPRGPVCGCGGRGCLETLASGGSVERLTGSSAKDVYERARGGDQTSIEVFENLGRNLGMGLSSLAQIFDPDLFVLGGQVGLAWEMFYPSLLQEFSERMSRHPAQTTPIVAAVCGNDAGILGGAFRVFETYGSSSA